MQFRRVASAVPIAAALLVAAAPATSSIITVTLSGNSENVNDNANVFGQGAGTLTDLPFVLTFLINTDVGVDSSGGYSSNSIFGANPPFAVSGSLSINGSTPFIVAGSNYSGAHDTVTTSTNPFFTTTTIDYDLITDDSTGVRLDNQLSASLSGGNLPTSLTQPITLALTSSNSDYVTFTKEVPGSTLPAAIGNLFPTLLTVSVPGAVPEPETWLTMICGFGAIGASLRRRTKVSFA